LNSSERFAQIFRGRTDYYGAWNGGAIEERVTLDHYHYHLFDESLIGIYPHLGSAGATWGCIDIDGADFPKEGAKDNPDYQRKQPEWHDWWAMETLACNLVKAMSMKDVKGHIERTRNGYHVWVFPTINVPASEMRRALMAACVVCKYDPNEVNPKQEILAEGKIGNYVRLPYPNNATTERVFLDPATMTPLALPYALDQIEWNLTNPAAITACSKLWTPPKKRHTVDTSVNAPAAVAQLRGLTRTIWDEGPLPGSDRSSTLAHLAHLCREQGLTAENAYAVICSADLRWGKFQPEGREDAVEQLTAIVERSYAT
jgi:hypothetical protein